MHLSPGRANNIVGYGGGLLAPPPSLPPTTLPRLLAHVLHPPLEVTSVISVSVKRFPGGGDALNVHSKGLDSTAGMSSTAGSIVDISGRVDHLRVFFICIAHEKKRKGRYSRKVGYFW